MSALKLAYDVKGEGEHALMLLHGFTGSRDSFAHLEPALRLGFRLVRVDLPGHGQTGLPRQEGRDGFIETLDALADVLDEAGIQKTHLFGYSQGGRIALAFALRHADRVERLVLESGAPGLHRRKDRIARRRDDEELAQRILRDGVAAFVQSWEEKPLFAGLKRLPPEQQEALRARRLSNTAEGLAGALRALGTGSQPDFWPELWKLRAPTLLLTGAADTKFTSLAKKMAADLPTVWSHAIPNAGHAPHLETPDIWTREVLSFLQTPWFDVPHVVPVERAGAPIR